jgi:glycosyltransferase involved in cell wall biosynthesis
MEDLSLELRPRIRKRRPPARPTRRPDIAVVIPCYNEEPTIAEVVDDFRRELPDARIIVVDNCSTDRSAAIAAARGATVLKEPRQGKGFVVQTMLEEIDADIYVMVDGDDTYPADKVHALLAPIRSGSAHMTVGTRLSAPTDKSFRRFHVLGNKLVQRLVNWIGDANLTDIMSGYRVFSRGVASRLPLVCAGFEVETDLTLQMLYYRLKVVEVEVPYRERPPGSQSKLRTFRDGARVLWTIFTLLRSFKPLTFFGGLGLVAFVLGLLAGVPPIMDYVTDPNHYVRHVPLAILATGLMILSAGSMFLGILLHAMNRRLQELHSVIVRRR